MPGVLNRDVLDRIVVVTDEDAVAWSRRLAREEGLLAGISAGAAALAACKVAAEMRARADRGDDPAGHRRALPEPWMQALQGRSTSDGGDRVHSRRRSGGRPANRDRVDVSAPDVGGLLDELERGYGGLKGLVRNEPGEVHQHVAIYVNSEPIDGLERAGHPARGRRRGRHHPCPGRRRPVRRGDPHRGRARRRSASQAVEEYPLESCGVILKPQAASGGCCAAATPRTSCTRVIPQRYPRDARTAYYIDPKDLLRIGDLERQGFDVAVIYHSHIDAGAYFSETDRRQAVVGRRAGVSWRRVRRDLGGRRAWSRRWPPSAGTRSGRDFVPVELAA